MVVFFTDQLTPETKLTSEANKQIYCALDSMVTLEVLGELRKQFNQPPAIYNFERALQAPYLEIMQRGFKVDELNRQQAANGLHQRVDHMQGMLDEFAGSVWDKGLNPRSPKQLKEFFYEKMKLPEVWISQKGQKKLSTNREALEKLSDGYLYARPFVNLILGIRELSKQLEVFETDIDSDGRFRTSYNIAGTETGRPSSSENAHGTGGNAQNINPTLRYVFVADKGKKLGVIDLEQVEARDVGFFTGCLFNDWKYLDSCEQGDLHTNNAKLVWKEALPWGQSPAQNRSLADRQFYRDFSYRDMAKRGGHLSNYYGSAWMMARTLKIPISVAEEFHARYIYGRKEYYDKRLRQTLPAIEPAFPAIARWWQWTAEQLQTTHQLTTPFGRRRHFFGRPGDDTTLREAIAYLPQSTTADRMNLGMWRVWKYMPQVQLLAQTYDSITFQFDETEKVDELIGRMLELIRVELRSPSGRLYVVPGEAKIGWNWGNQVTQADIDKAKALGKRLPRLNLDGLAKWKPGKPDLRSRQTGFDRSMVG